MIGLARRRPRCGLSWLAAALLAASATAVAAGPDDVPRCFMWRVSGDAGTVHLLGSIHFMKDDAYPLDPAIERAYTAADTVVFETDLDQAGQAGAEMLRKGTLAGDLTLLDVIGDERYHQLESWLSERGLGTAMFNRMRPWMVALSVAAFELQRQGYLGTHGIDVTFADRATSDGKRIVALETFDFQISLFADMTDAQGAEFLGYTLTELDTIEPLIDDVVAAWQSGDVATIETLLADGFDEHPELYRKLVTDRNQRWLPVVEQLLGTEGDALVVVGALHLVGDNGLIEMLRSKGYEVEQVPRLSVGRP
ncbi:MAG: TraB/GumN family protein [Holophagae bacterium]